MTYRKEWKGHLKVNGGVHWDGVLLGHIFSKHVEGAKSPGGMVTNVLWYWTNRHMPGVTDEQVVKSELLGSMDLAIAALLKEKQIQC